MKTKILKYTAALLIITGTISVTSCKKILDLEPHNSTFTNAYFTNGNDANTAIAGAYALLRGVLLNNSSFHVYGDATTSEFSINSGLDNQNYNISNGEYTGLNVGSANWNWLNYYQLLQQINLIIAKVPDIPIERFTNQDEKKQIIGEAYFLRAFTYFYMSRVWGDVPLKLVPDLDVSQAKNIPRTPAATVLKQCLADLKIAESDLVFGYADENQRAVRANKGAAYALEAHVEAWTHDYAACEKSTAQVINSNDYHLAAADSASLKKVFEGKSLEGIFEININYGQNEGIAINGGGYVPVLKSPFIDKKVNLEWPLNTSYIAKLYPLDTADLRYKVYFFQGKTTEGQTIKFSNIIYADGSTKNDPRLSNNLIIFRLADIILLRAEALNQLGRDGEAIPLLNQIRKRAHLANYDGGGSIGLTQTILEERLRELFYEGQSFYDLVRTKIVGNPTSSFIELYTNQSGTKEFNDTRINAGGNYWPIDPGMFKDDFVLTQTPYWQGKL